jgi:hypothetical protein
LFFSETNTYTFLKEQHIPLFHVLRKKEGVWGIVSSPYIYGTTAKLPDFESLGVYSVPVAQ